MLQIQIKNKPLCNVVCYVSILKYVILKQLVITVAKSHGLQTFLEGI